MTVGESQHEFCYFYWRKTYCYSKPQWQSDIRKYWSGSLCADSSEKALMFIPWHRYYVYLMGRSSVIATDFRCFNTDKLLVKFGTVFTIRDGKIEDNLKWKKKPNRAGWCSHSVEFLSIIAMDIVDKASYHYWDVLLCNCTTWNLHLCYSVTLLCLADNVWYLYR